MIQNSFVQSGERVEKLGLGEMLIIQPQKGYRFSIDPILLCHFSRITPGAHVADLGTGSAVMPLLLAQRHQGTTFVALEYQPAMVDRARRSVKLNRLEDRIEVILGDVRSLPGKMAAERCDVVLMNPPYRTPSAGRLAPDDERAAARHELAGGCRDFLRAAAVLLGGGGRVSLIYLAERLADLLGDMRSLRLEPKRLRMVHSRQGQAARLVLVEGRKDGRPGLTVEPSLVIYKGEGRDYTEDVLQMYQ